MAEHLDGLRIGIPKTRWRQTELVVNVSARLEGQLADWPANIQDEVYKALERFKHKERADFKIVYSYSDVDVDEGPYIHVIAVYLETVQ